MAKIGSIEVVTGCMFAGKTEELIRQARTLQRTNHKVCIVKPKIDNRYADEKIISHDGNSIPAISVNNALDILKNIEKDIDAICIDEVQFLGQDVVRVIEHLANQGVSVLAVGLDTDFRGEPFGVMPDLLARATHVTKLTSYCAKCGAEATRTQRLIDKQPASFYDPVVLVGAAESYEARCRNCHEVLDLPKYF